MFDLSLIDWMALSAAISTVVMAICAIKSHTKQNVQIRTSFKDNVNECLLGIRKCMSIVMSKGTGVSVNDCSECLSLTMKETYYAKQFLPKEIFQRIENYRKSFLDFGFKGERLGRYLSGMVDNDDRFLEDKVERDKYIDELYKLQNFLTGEPDLIDENVKNWMDGK